MDVFARSNSLDSNPPTADRHITEGGTNWLWVVTALMGISTLIMAVWSFMRPRGTRVFHQLALVVLMTATIAYFSMASDLGYTPVRAEFSRGNTNTRQIWYVRYIQWFITLPCILLILLLTSAVTLSDIFTTVFFGWVVVICGLVGALVPSTYKWGYYVLGLFALFYLWFHLLGYASRTAFAHGAGMRTHFLGGAGWLSFLLLLYPICWGVSEGGNVISPTREMIFYGILDLFAGPIFLFSILFTLRSLDFAPLGLASGKYTDTGFGPGAGYGAGAGAGYGANGAGSGVAGNGAGVNRAGNGAGPGMTGVGNGVTGAGAGGPGVANTAPGAGVV